MFQRYFVFGRAGLDGAAGESITVTAADCYRPDRGYGFVTEADRREQESLQLPELNSGFDTLYWYRNTDLSAIQEDETGCFLDSAGRVRSLEEGARGGIPLIFRADVPKPGNYRVTVFIRPQASMGKALIFTGCRRLGFLGEIPAGDTFVRSMTVNVCDIVPRGRTDSFAHKSLSIAILADRPGISAIRLEEISCPVLYIAGDSTVTDQSAEYPYTPGTCYSGWGQMLPAFLDGRAAVSNHAHSGLTTDSFRSEGHYEIVQRFIRPGDYYFMQFGHNDQKLQELKAEEGYRENLLRYIRECRDAGAYPLIVTPLARNTWKGNSGTYNDLLAEYAAACLEVGEQENVPVLDLHRRAMEFICRKGLEASKLYFHPDDYTHSNDYGAYLFAGMVAEEICRVCGGHHEAAYRFLAESVTGGFGPWEPPEKIEMPRKPKKYENMSNPQEEAPLFAEIKDPAAPVDRATALHMLIKTARFFPTNVYNDMFRDIVGHEWYAGAVECAYQNGMIEESLVKEGCFLPEKQITLEEFLVFAVNAYRSRKTLPEERPCAYDDRCGEASRRFVRAACAIGLLDREGGEDLSRLLSVGEAAELCRRMRI